MRGRTALALAAACVAAQCAATGFVVTGPPAALSAAEVSHQAPDCGAKPCCGCAPFLVACEMAVPCEGEELGEGVDGLCCSASQERAGAPGGVPLKTTPSPQPGTLSGLVPPGSRAAPAPMPRSSQPESSGLPEPSLPPTPMDGATGGGASARRQEAAPSHRLVRADRSRTRVPCVGPRLTACATAEQ
jgi:hypothetical protein